MKLALSSVLIVLVAGYAAAAGEYSDVPKWATRAIAEARGEIRVAPNGERVAVRYKGWPTRDFGAFRTYAYDDPRPEPPVRRSAMPAGLTGDAKKGRALFMARAKGPCTGCHLVPGDDVWPAGNVGPDLSTIGERGLSNDYLYAVISDARVMFPNTSMPPWGEAGVLMPEEVAHLVAYVQTLKGPRPPERDRDRDPATRSRPVGFGDNLDPANNPGVLLAESAEELWTRKGRAGRACADCHRGSPMEGMKGVATRYPKFVKAFGRVMSVEDFLTVHAPDTTGERMDAESAENLNMTMLIKMASNGMPMNVDVSSPEARRALARGAASFNKRVGERNHACADCHTPARGANKFLGGRVLGDVNDGSPRYFPTWRTGVAEVWDMRKRMQWCMTPLGTNMLAADAVEYAELELYLTAFDNGKAMSVPGLRH